MLFIVLEISASGSERGCCDFEEFVTFMTPGLATSVFELELRNMRGDAEVVSLPEDNSEKRNDDVK